MEVNVGMRPPRGRYVTQRRAVRVTSSFTNDSRLQLDDWWTKQQPVILSVHFYRVRGSCDEPLEHTILYRTVSIESTVGCVMNLASLPPYLRAERIEPSGTRNRTEWELPTTG